jgi:hypothetical protein
LGKALVVAPRFDDETVYSYEWSREIVDWLKTAMYDVVDIGGRTVRRGEVEDALKQNIELYVNYNHGSEECHWGSSTEKVVDLNNDSLLGGKEVYCMNCLSASKLGRDAVKNKGCVAYYGYTDVFAFSTDALDDFKTFANAGLKYRLCGYSWQQVVLMVKRLADILVEKLYKDGKFIAASAMQHDADVLVCWESGNVPESKSWIDKLIEDIKKFIEWIRRVIGEKGRGCIS